MKPDIRWACIAWAPYSRRSEVFAKTLDGDLYCVHYLRFQSPLHALPKYVLQAFKTWQILFSKRPQAVHVQNPPFVCGLVVYVYCMLSGAKFVVDHHSAAFGAIWKKALPMQKFLARQAATNIVTNQHWADIVTSWGGHAIIMGDPFLPLSSDESIELATGFNITFVNTFAADEPLDAVLAAAARTPQVNFYITGNTNRKPASFFEGSPSNVVFTGFLPEQQYVALLKTTDAIMVLTTRNHTLQLGGCEAVSVGQPLITSNWPFFCKVFLGKVQSM